MISFLVSIFKCFFSILVIVVYFCIHCGGAVTAFLVWILPFDCHLDLRAVFPVSLNKQTWWQWWWYIWCYARPNVSVRGQQLAKCWSSLSVAILKLRVQKLKVTRRRRWQYWNFVLIHAVFRFNFISISCHSDDLDIIRFGILNKTREIADAMFQYFCTISL